MRDDFFKLKCQSKLTHKNTCEISNNLKEKKNAEKCYNKIEKINLTQIMT